MVYLITCQCCKLQYVGLAITFKKMFRIHQSNIDTYKMKRAKPKRYLKCCTGVSKFDNLKIQPIEYANVSLNLLKQEL